MSSVNSLYWYCSCKSYQSEVHSTCKSLPSYVPSPYHPKAIRHLRQQALSQAEDPILRTLIDKLANAAIGGLTRGYLGEDRATQLEAALAVKVDENKNTRKHTALTKAKAMTGEELLNNSRN